jgi:2-dehydro-3-deoxy-D-arabinonate dehydratase
MQLCRFTVGDDPTPRVGLMDASAICELGADGSVLSIDQLLTLSAAQLRAALTTTDLKNQPVHLRGDCTLLKPIESQEVWACGVTYERSLHARMEEAIEKSIYDRVYEADRPLAGRLEEDLRAVGPGQAVRIRQDSTWDVPEPELALVVNRHLELVGLTIGNDMSSRGIEGENPLYLAQAKVYDASCALGPVIVPIWEVAEPKGLSVALTIERGGAVVFQGESSTGLIRRPLEYLIGYLGRDQTFPHGVVLLTGTGIVPGNDFTLQPGDVVTITIDPIGTLTNPVARGA